MKSMIHFKTENDNEYILDKNMQYVLYLKKELKNAILGEDSRNTNYYIKKRNWLIANGFNRGELQIEFPEITNITIELQLDYISQIVFEVTEKCNLNCKYCAYSNIYSDFDTREGKNLCFKTGKSIIDYFIDRWNTIDIKPYPPRKVYISFYGGEPLLNFEFIQNLVSYIKEIKIDYIRFCFAMTTNGILIKKYLNFLVDNDFELLISLDGNLENNSYRTYRNGKNSFKNVYENIRHIKHQFPQYFEKKVNINSVLHKKNSLDDIFNFVNKEFNKIPRTGELNTHGIKKEKLSIFKSIFQDIQESFNNSISYQEIESLLFTSIPQKFDLIHFIHNRSGNVFYTLKEFVVDKRSKIKRKTGTCLPFENKIFITANKKILPCTTLDHRFSIGYIDDDDNIKINTKEIAAFFNKCLDSVFEQCINCYCIDSCTKCVFLTKFSNNSFLCNSFSSKRHFSEEMALLYSDLENNPIGYKKIIENVMIY